MKFLAIRSYDNYIPAHLALGRLKEDGIQGWLKDENTVTIDPILSNAVGGIKLMVAADDAEKAISILDELEKKYTATMACPWCRSHNIDLVSSPRKVTNWLSAISTFILGNFAIAAEKEYHCFDCNREFLTPLAITPIEETDSGLSS